MSVGMKAVAPIFPRSMRRLHLHSPQFPAHVQDEVKRIAITPGLRNPKSHLRRLSQERRFRHLPTTFTSHRLCGAGALARGSWCDVGPGALACGLCLYLSGAGITARDFPPLARTPALPFTPQPPDLRHRI